MKNYKQLIAGAMAAIMVLGSSVIALAADQSGETHGGGSLDVLEKTDIFDVILPVLPTSGSPFDYILDPTGVIGEDSSKYGDKTFESNKSLYFSVSGGDADYMSSSEKLVVTNKSTMSVQVTVEASVPQVTGITMADNTFFDDSGAQLYLGLKDNANHNDDAIAITVEGIEATATINGAADYYEIKYVTDGNAGGAYKRKLKEDVTDDVFATYKFWLEGASGGTGWDKVTGTLPTIDVVWTVKDPTGDASPSTDETNYTMTNGQSVYVQLNFGEGSAAATGITSISYKNSTNVDTILPTDKYALEGEDGKTLRFKATYIDSLLSGGINSRDFTITFNDAASTTVTITLSKN